MSSAISDCTCLWTNHEGGGAVYIADKDCPARPHSRTYVMCDLCGLRVAEFGEDNMYCVRCWNDQEPDEPQEPVEDPFYRTNAYDITKERP